MLSRARLTDGCRAPIITSRREASGFVLGLLAFSRCRDIAPIGEFPMPLRQWLASESCSHPIAALPRWRVFQSSRFWFCPTVRGRRMVITTDSYGPCRRGAAIMVGGFVLVGAGLLALLYMDWKKGLTNPAPERDGRYAARACGRRCIVSAELLDLPWCFRQWQWPRRGAA
jgi:hypothetical protein